MKLKVALDFCSTNKVYNDDAKSIPIAKRKNGYRFSEGNYRKRVLECFPIGHCRHHPYGTSKYAADIYVEEYARTYRLRAAMLQMSCISGTGQLDVEDHGWISHFAPRALRNPTIHICRDGEQVREVRCVSDPVRAMRKFPDKDVTTGVFEVGGGPETALILNGLL